jgi:hypothetical protein
MTRRHLLGFGAALGVTACRSAGVSPQRTMRSAAPDLTGVPPALGDAMQSLMRWLAETGWAEYLGLRLPEGAPWRALLDVPFAPPARRGFCDFAGSHLIHPGHPELSALYHGLASPCVVRDECDALYASLEQLDQLEDFIYALSEHEIPSDQRADYAIAVLAYEYRPAIKTPHGRHADLVFARTGLARVGDTAARYDDRRRSFTAAADLPRGAIPVAPARYGLFLVRAAGADELGDGVTGAEKNDDRREFVYPIRKLFTGDPYLGGATLHYQQQHRSERLRRLALHDPTAVVFAPKFRLDEAPFVRVSCGDERTTLPGHTSELVRLCRRGSSVLVEPIAREMVRPATQGPERVHFSVPPSSRIERRYSTLKLLNHPWRERADVLGQQAFRARDPVPFGVARSAPMFVNIRYRLCPDGSITHLDNEESTAPLIAAGGYEAAVFEDDICDGCVTVALEGADEPRLAAEVLSRVLPAFSVVTAPDFIPLADAIDLGRADDRLDDNFFEGTATPLSWVRLRANPAIVIPGTSPARSAFSPEDDARALERRVGDTVTAMVSGPAHDATRARNRDVSPPPRASFLPDAASGFFYPGWDLTHSSPAEGSGARFLASFALGLPFVEDLKLCAAGNGMWPAAAPDMARSFQGSLERIVLWRPPTAIPLMDQELGAHPGSPAVREHGAASQRGWDGEYGPHLECVRGKVFISYSDVARVDYVENFRGGRFDPALLRELSTDELVARMGALRRCIDRLDDQQVRHSKLWLASAEPVACWEAGPGAGGARASGLPTGIHGVDGQWATQAGSELRGPGYLFLFVWADGEPVARDATRALKPCRALHVCKVSERRVLARSIDLTRMRV